MKKLLIVMLLLVFCGCQEENKYNLPEQWVNQFGSDAQSAWLLKASQIIDAHSKKLLELDGRVKGVEAKAIMDGEEVDLFSPAPGAFGIDAEWSNATITKVDPNEN